MYDLILDSSDKELLVAVAKDETIVDKIEYEAWQKQSELMVQELDNLFKRNNINKLDISSILLTIGPGSYTGIRIALTIAKVIAYSLNIKIYPFSSLQILQFEKKPSICLINARSCRSYIGVYDGNKTILKDQNISKCKYLYYEWFGQISDDLEKMITTCYQELKKPYTLKIHEVASLIRLSYKEPL